MADTFTDGFCLKLIGLLDDNQIKPGLLNYRATLEFHIYQVIYHKAI